MYIAPSYKVVIPILSLFGALSILAFQHIENSSEPIPVAPQNNPVVLELFTSQSCPTCENADIIVNTIKDYENVIVLSYHIDYWNQLGWIDTFSDANHTNYQRKYERRFDRNSYAPQMVVNGKSEFDGTNIRLLNGSLKKQSTTEKLLTPKIYREENKSVSVYYDFFTEKKYDKAYALLIMDSCDVAIDNGPNIGKMMTNTNIVINRVPLQLDNSKGNYTFKLPPNLKETDQFKVAIILQDNNLNMVGAAVSKMQ
ncbi:DUF1223 domain-containing protein [Nonlabens sp. Ci31]|jgi:hypothetical protein|uniref:DUF1223 domain-containing protein n=1 Tax=Nonlabens sp. Ci31 TaxID=2608253 RepID=UPI0014643ABE|nr:DUF1223 domain-containing protein [Nonlabens sp. Ci31]QJP35736.1 DUF1223 domain-containing protein [Nonlabens sp. Ci31]